MNPPPTEPSTIVTPGIERISFSTASTASLMAGRLDPSGEVTLTSNSPSSTPVGTNSCRTSE